MLLRRLASSSSAKDLETTYQVCGDCRQRRPVRHLAEDSD
jgi:hypothetical protein